MLGEAAGVGAAVCWAIGSVLFARVSIAPAAINLFKNSVSATLLVATVWIVSRGFESDFVGVAWLTASSIIGLVIGDTCHFRSLQVLGPRRAVTLETMAPPFSVLAGWIFLGEWPTLAIGLGMGVTLIGIVAVVGDRAERFGNINLDGDPRVGAFFGVLAALGQAVGAALSKVGIRHIESLTPGTSASLEAACIRLVAAALIGFGLAVAAGRIRGWWRQVALSGEWRILLPASLIGAYAGVWLSMIAFRNTEVSVATTLTALTPIFVLPLVAILFRERLTRRGLIGALLAVVGVAVLSAR